MNESTKPVPNIFKPFFKFLSTLFSVLIITLGVTFAVLNSKSVSINYFIGQKTLPLALLIIIILFFGTLLGFFAGLLLYFKSKRENRRIKRKMNLLKKEISNLRVIPLKDTP